MQPLHLRVHGRTVAAVCVGQVAELVQHGAVLDQHQQQRQNPRERRSTHS